MEHDMEIVQKFNAELSSLYDVPLPISKVKIHKITHLAMSALRMYKHIVQSVERFIHKCRPEYKLPALYVIDSIVRQSRKVCTSLEAELYGPRFARNFPTTFENLFLTCLAEDKPKIVRTLNLWQRNNVFSPETIQPLLDLANPNAQLERMMMGGLGAGRSHRGGGGPNLSPKTEKLQTAAGAAASAVTVLASNLNKAENGTLVEQLQKLASSLELLEREKAKLKKVKELETIAKYPDDGEDYDQATGGGHDRDADPIDDDEEGTPTEAEPMYTRPKQHRSEELSAGLNAKIDSFSSIVNSFFQLNDDETLTSGSQSSDPTSGANNYLLNEKSNGASGGGDLHHYKHDRGSGSAEYLQEDGPGASSYSHHHHHHADELGIYPAEFIHHSERSSKRSRNLERSRSRSPSPPLPRSDRGDLRRPTGTSSSRYTSASSSSRRDREHRSSDRRDRDRDRDRYRSARSRTRSPRSRSRSKSRSRSRSPRDRFSRSPPPPSKPIESEAERLRRQKGLPSSFKPHCLVVASTTLWLGHVPKYASESDLSDFFGDFGDLRSIHLIPSRGCAYICMVRRVDAQTAFTRLKKNNKILGFNVKCAWAPGKALKERNYQNFWEMTPGVAMIPWSALDEDVNLEFLEEGGAIEDDTVPEKLQEKLKTMRSEQLKKAAAGEDGGQQSGKEPEAPVTDPEVAAAAAAVPVVPNPLAAMMAAASYPQPVLPPGATPAGYPPGMFPPQPGQFPPPPPFAHHPMMMRVPPGVLPPGMGHHPPGPWNPNGDSHDGEGGVKGPMVPGPYGMPPPYQQLMPPPPGSLPPLPPPPHQNLHPPPPPPFGPYSRTAEPHSKDRYTAAAAGQQHNFGSPNNKSTGPSQGPGAAAAGSPPEDQDQQSLEGHHRIKPFTINFNNNNNSSRGNQQSGPRPALTRSGKAIPQLSPMPPQGPPPPTLMPMRPPGPPGPPGPAVGDHPPPPFYHDDPFGPSAFESKFGPNGEMMGPDGAPHPPPFGHPPGPPAPPVPPHFEMRPPPPPFNRAPTFNRPPGFIPRAVHRGGPPPPMHLAPLPNGPPTLRPFWPGPGGPPGGRRNGGDRNASQSNANNNNFRSVGNNNRPRGSIRNSRWQAPVPGRLNAQQTSNQQVQPEEQGQPDSTSNTDVPGEEMQFSLEDMITTRPPSNGQPQQGTVDSTECFDEPRQQQQMAPEEDAHPLQPASPVKQVDHGAGSILDDSRNFSTEPRLIEED